MYQVIIYNYPSRARRVEEYGSEKRALNYFYGLCHKHNLDNIESDKYGNYTAGGIGYDYYIQLIVPND